MWKQLLTISLQRKNKRRRNDFALASGAPRVGPPTQDVDSEVINIDEEEKEYPVIEGYENAFNFVIFNQSGPRILLDSISVYVVSVVLIHYFGSIFPFTFVMQWLIDADWWSIPYIILPLGFTVYLVFYKDKDGLGAWQWLFISLMFRLKWRKKYVPLQEWEKGAERD